MPQNFDVFLSHNSQDKPAVRELGEALKARGLRVWLDEWELVPGRPWQEAIEEIVRTTKSAAVLIGRDGFGPWHDREMRACLSEFVNRDMPVIPVLLPEAPSKPDLPMFLAQFTWVDLRSGLTDEGLGRLKWGITGARPAIDASGAESKADQEVQHVVILIHGIRSFAAWHHAVEQAMGGADIRIVAPRYGWFPALRFLAPWNTSNGPMRRVYREFRNARRAFPKAKISVIAHSFGTYLLARILGEYPDIVIWRVIVCGSVMRQGFEWERVIEQIGDREDRSGHYYVLNDCGNRDVWPVLGASAGWRYGNAGTDGFGSVYVQDRFHDGNHGLFFNKSFIQKYWDPFIRRGHIEAGPATQGEGVPWWVRTVAMLPLRWLQILIPVMIIAAVYCCWIGDEPPPPPPKLAKVSFNQFVAAFLSALTECGIDPDKFSGDYEQARTKDQDSMPWQCCIVRVDSENKRYYVWKTDCTPPPDGVYIAAIFDNGDFKSSLKPDTTITVDGRILEIDIQNKRVLIECASFGIVKAAP